MDCMTISTFRSLERQAIQQRNYEVFAQKNVQPTETVKEEKLPVSTQNTEELNYYA